jgi:ribosomal protein L13E
MKKSTKKTTTGVGETPAPATPQPEAVGVSVRDASNIVIGIDMKRRPEDSAAMTALASAISENARAAQTLAKAFLPPENSTGVSISMADLNRRPPF